MSREALHEAIKATEALNKEMEILQHRAAVARAHLALAVEMADASTSALREAIVHREADRYEALLTEVTRQSLKVRESYDAQKVAFENRRHQ